VANKIDIVNRRVFREFELIERFTAGMVLLGTEIKSIRGGKASLSDSWCYFKEGELWVKGMSITPYELGTHANHEPLRERKLLLTRHELLKLNRKVKERGFTIVVLRLFISENGLAKTEIALARGKAIHDKRSDIREKDLNRDMGRHLKNS
jgi:SsrA-binding protein